MGTIRTTLMLLAGLALLAGCAGGKNGAESKQAAPPAEETVVTLTTVQGDILVRFFPDSAPEHVKNFIWHAENTYPGCTFHRVIPGFMIQGGDPNTKNDDPADDGMGGYSYHGEGTDLPAEFNTRPHERGILSMARSQDPNSAGSQFFVMHGDAPFLDSKYTVFGEVIDGIEVVDKIVNIDRDKRDRPRQDQSILSTKVETWPTPKVNETRDLMIAGDPAAN
jgi:peptidyl-prolyl cis-trans isomerase B (cyclophilin B)